MGSRLRVVRAPHPKFTRFGDCFVDRRECRLGSAWLGGPNTLGNLIAGISLLIYRPFHVGDIIQVTVGSTVEVGEVETVTLGYTVIQTSPNRRILVPNSSVISQTVINFASTDPRQTVEVLFSVGYKSSLKKVKTLALE